MDSYGSHGGAAGSQPSEAQVMEQVQRDMQMLALQEFYTTVRDKCFEKCITKPGSSLSSSEQQCLSRCADRYSDALQVVGKAVLDVTSADH